MIIYAALGGLCIVWAGIAVAGRGRPAKKPGRPDWLTVWVLLPLLLALTFALIRLEKPTHSKDDCEYSSYATRFQTVDELSFSEILYPPLDRLDYTRWWLAGWQGAEAYLSWMSGVHSLPLMTMFLPSICMVLALLSLWGLARGLGFNPAFASLSVVIQVGTFFLTTYEKGQGEFVFSRMAQDKTVVAYILAPVLFRLITAYLADPTRRRLAVVAAAAAALVLTHSTVTGIAFMVAAAYVFYVKLARRQPWRTMLAVVAVLVVAISPYILIRVLSVHGYTLDSVEEVFSYKTDLRISTWGSSGQLYGFNHRFMLFELEDVAVNILNEYGGLNIGTRLDGIIPYLGIAILGVGMLAVFLDRFRDQSALFVAALLTVVAAGLLPLTGWMLGIFLSPLQLWRVSLFAMYGLAGAYAVQVVLNRLPDTKDAARVRIRTRVVPAVLGIALMLGCYAAGIIGPRPILISARIDRPHRDFLFNMAEIGERIDALPDPDPLVVGTAPANFYLLGSSSNAEVVAPRGVRYLILHNIPAEVANRRQAAWNEMTNAGTRAERRLELFEEYGVEYLVFSEDDDFMLDLLDGYPGRFAVLDRVSDLYLVQVQ